ncbi:hypothetical protein ACCT08_07495 [Rhizobium johnstonii]|uniref:phosphorylase family protein n=1 Tax=Rhizobium TaxID=379 RepID=UPI002E0FE513|nr:hypothetical protein U8P75_16280 [Rhizobium beringeri]WSH78857.1 hypothetical protein U8P69_16170 [Rhizobium beringeri]
MSDEDRDVEVLKHLLESFPLPFLVNGNPAQQAGAQLLIENELTFRESTMTKKGPAQNWITCGASKEAEFIRRAIEVLGGTSTPAKVSKSLFGFQCKVPTKYGSNSVDFNLISANGTGKSPQTGLLRTISEESEPNNVILVGMMGGIKPKANLFDVVIPTDIYDGTNLGTDHAGPKWYRTSRPMNETFAAVTANYALMIAAELGIIIRNTKRVVSTGDTIEDVEAQLFKEIREVDPEEIIGMEMEGYAVLEANSSQLQRGKHTVHGFVKAIADFGKHPLSEKEMEAVRAAIPELASETDITPRSNDKHKQHMQEYATTIALKCAVNLLALLEQS